MGALRWRPPTRDDDEAWAELLAAIEAVDRRGEAYGAQDLDDEWRSVWAYPETDAVFGWDGAQLAAFGWLKTQPSAAGPHRIELWGGVRPSHRGRGIGSELLDRMVARAEAVAAALPGTAPVALHLTLLATQEDAVRLAGARGFRRVREFLELVRPLDVPIPDAPPVPGLRLHRWEPALDAATRDAHADSFRDHWGSEPRTEEEWRQWYTGHRGFRPDLSAVAVSSAGEVAGLVLSAAYPLDWETGVAPVELWVSTVGTRRAWRGRGVARWLLTEVLRAARGAPTGFERVILGVDAENPTGALALYRGLGFRAVRSVGTWERLVRADRAAETPLG